MQRRWVLAAEWSECARVIISDWPSAARWIGGWCAALRFLKLPEMIDAIQLAIRSIPFSAHSAFAMPIARWIVAQCFNFDRLKPSAEDPIESSIKMQLSKGNWIALPVFLTILLSCSRIFNGIGSTCKDFYSNYWFISLFKIHLEFLKKLDGILIRTVYSLNYFKFFEFIFKLNRSSSTYKDFNYYYLFIWLV